MPKKTFLERYYAEKARPTHAQEFIDEVAKIAFVTPFTVRMWIAGNQKPGDLVKNVLAQHFGCTPEELFPPVENEKENENGK